PHRIVMATGPEGSAYAEDGKRYRSALAKTGVEVQLRSTAGSVETAALLRDPHSGVSVGLMQGGVVGAANAAGLEPAGAVPCEPLWWFRRRKNQGVGADGLRGRKIAADAFVALYPFLNKVIVPRGVMDLARDQPPADVSLIATKTSLVVREDLH